MHRSALIYFTLSRYWWAERKRKVSHESQLGEKGAFVSFVTGLASLLIRIEFWFQKIQSFDRSDMKISFRTTFPELCTV